MKTLAEMEASLERETMIDLGMRVVRKGSTRPEGTVVRIFTSARNGKLMARVRWDRTIGGGVETHSAVAVTGLRAA